MKSLENRIKQLEEKLKPKSKIHTVVDWSLGDGEAEKRIAEIKKLIRKQKLKSLKSNGFDTVSHLARGKRMSRTVYKSATMTLPGCGQRQTLKKRSLKILNPSGSRCNAPDWNRV